MSFQLYDLDLAERESARQERKLARQRVWQAAFSGEEADAADLATARGLVLRRNQEGIFSDAWIFIALLVLVLGLLDNRNAALLALGLILLIIVGVSTLWKNLALLGVSYDRSFDRTHAFPNEPVEMTLTVANDKPLPLSWLRFRDILPVSPETDNVISQAAVDVSEQYILVNSFSMHGNERTKRTLTLHFPARGYYRLGPVTYQSGDIFTLFSVERVYNALDTIVIYPEINSLEDLGLPAKEPFGEARVLRSMFTDPIRTRGIRDYQPGDRFRDIHWKATARRGQLQTRVFDPSTSMTMAIFLNVATLPKHWMGFYPELLERAVSVAASVANHGVEQGWGVGLYANGAFPNSDQPIRVPPGRSPGQLTHILEGLAAVTEFATASIEQMALRESPNLPWASTIVLVTAVLTEEIVVALLRLQEAGRRVALLSLEETPVMEGLGSILTYHIPAGVVAFKLRRPLDEDIFQPHKERRTSSPELLSS